MATATSRPRFGRLAATSIVATAALMAGGAGLSCWRTGRHGLHEAAVAAVAVLTPMLAVGRITAIAWRYDRMLAGRLFAGVRLTAVRFAVAVGLLIAGVEIVGLQGEQPLLWFALLYVVLLSIEVCWLSGAYRRLGAAGEDRA